MLKFTFLFQVHFFFFDEFGIMEKLNLTLSLFSLYLIQTMKLITL